MPTVGLLDLILYIHTSGSTLGAYLFTGTPFLSIRNLVKFHLMKLKNNKNIVISTPYDQINKLYECNVKIIFLIHQLKPMLWVLNCLIEMVTMILSTHNICFCGEIGNLILNYTRWHILTLSS